MIYKIGNRKEDLNGKRIRKIATGEKVKWKLENKSIREKTRVNERF